MGTAAMHPEFLRMEIIQALYSGTSSRRTGGTSRTHWTMCCCQGRGCYRISSMELLNHRYGKVQNTKVTSILEVKLKNLSLEAWNSIKQSVNLREGTTKPGDGT
ncbi:hypothetical protein MRB53_030329 [Persea americana]|uniref:Uncharacterized protein n=1 Tax=Persea americana TaxID=3435 RepID=A0ACC2KKV8_PERAE|nr:hypothetical protein MRB53_030329 [Persea americana]